MPFELFVAIRYLRDGRLQTWLILTGIGVGVAVIVFLSALITGLQQSIIDRTLGSQAHVVVRPPEEMPRVLPLADSAAGEAPIRSVQRQRPPQRIRSIVGWKQVEALLERTPGVVAVAPTVTGPALAVRGPGTNSVTIRGIELETYSAIVDVQGRLVEGSFNLDGFHAVVGTELARRLGIGVGGRLRIQAAADRSAVYTVAGIFDYGSRSLNGGLIFISLRGGQTLFDLQGGVSTLEIVGKDIFQADALAARIQDRTGLVADSWMAQNRDLLTGLRSQSASSIMIQVFVILAVALGIASVLAVSVVQKAKEIGILRATGTKAPAVTRIFLIQGALLGIVGSLVGIALGTALSFLFASLARNPDGSATFPVALTAYLYARSVAVALVVGVISAIVPAWNAARMDPATVIRNG